MGCWTGEGCWTREGGSLKEERVLGTQGSSAAVAGSQCLVRGGLNILHLMPLSYGLYTFRYQNKLDLKLAPGDIC